MGKENFYYRFGVISDLCHLMYCKFLTAFWTSLKGIVLLISLLNLRFRGRTRARSFYPTILLPSLLLHPLTISVIFPS